MSICFYQSNSTKNNKNRQKGGIKLKKRIVVLLGLILAYLFWSETPRNETSPFSSFSFDSFEAVFQSPKAREVFDLDEEEAVAVFGDLFKDQYV